MNELSRNKLDTVLKSIGFNKDGRFYKHSDCHHLFLEFMTFPATIGEDYHIVPDEMMIEGKTIKIFSPTDCVRDRLAGYMHFKSRDNFDQAVLVAKKHPINLKKIQKRCESERHPEVFAEFKSKLNSDQ